MSLLITLRQVRYGIYFSMASLDRRADIRGAALLIRLDSSVNWISQ